MLNMYFAAALVVSITFGACEQTPPTDTPAASSAAQEGEGIELPTDPNTLRERGMLCEDEIKRAKKKCPVTLDIEAQTSRAFCQLSARVKLGRFKYVARRKLRFTYLCGDEANFTYVCKTADLNTVANAFLQATLECTRKVLEQQALCSHNGGTLVNFTDALEECPATERYLCTSDELYTNYGKMPPLPLPNEQP